MQTLRSLFTISADTLTAYDKTVYNKIPYTSSLHANLDCELQDPNLSQVIFDSYVRHISATLTEDQKDPFEQAVLDVALLFGSEQYPPTQALEKSLKKRGFAYDAWADAHKDALAFFIQDTVLAKPEKDLTKRQFRVCLLHTTASGGNTAVTRALDAFLQARNVDCHTIDVETLAAQHDAIKMATGFTYDGVYAEFFQKRNEAGTQRGLSLVLTDRAALNREIAKYIKPRTQELLKAKIAAIAPDLILSTRSYTADDIGLAYSLGIPMRLIYCDYDLFIQTNHVGKTHPELFKFWVPTLTARPFGFLFDTLGAKSEYAIEDTWQTTAQKLSRLTISTFEEISASFEEMGYPVGPEYTRITDTETLATLRKKWDVQNGEHLVVVTMGKNGVGVMEEIFSTLAKSPRHDTSIKYLFICGSNKELHAKLSEQAARLDLSQTALKRVAITGLISHPEMGEVMNICALKCSKPGGGASAQCRTMGVTMFSMHAHKLWESGNERELANAELVVEHDPLKPLTDQIESAITNRTKKPFEPPVDWKTKVTQQLKAIAHLE